MANIGGESWLKYGGFNEKNSLYLLFKNLKFLCVIVTSNILRR